MVLQNLDAILPATQNADVNSININGLWGKVGIGYPVPFPLSCYCIILHTSTFHLSDV